MLSLAKGVFITGTDTDVGKTVISCGIIKYLSKKGFSVAGMKPVASGCKKTENGLRNSDALRLIEASGLDIDYRLVNPYAFEEPIAPHIAAIQTQTDISLEMIKDCFKQLSEKVDAVVVEGVGGWLVPLKDDIGIDDMVSALQLPVIIVVDIRLGCLNHALLTCENILDKGLFLGGWVANQATPDQMYVAEQINSLRERIPAPLLGEVTYKKGITVDDVVKCLHLPF